MVEDRPVSPDDLLRARYPWMSMAPNVAWFRAKQNDREAQHVLAHCYLKGIQQEKSVKNASIWFGRAAQAGHMGAQYQYGLLWLAGRGVSKQDEDEAVKWLRRAAESGHPEAMYNLGVMSLSGSGVPESPEVAISWFEQAAELGFKEAQYRFALFLETLQVSTDHPKQKQDAKSARKRKSLATLQAAHQGKDPGAVRVRKNRALGWYLRAAKQGHAMAQHRAGILYAEACHPQDDREIRELKLWPSRPSVVTWGKSLEASVRVREARPFSSLSSVVTWFSTPLEQGEKTDWRQAAYWHKKAAKDMVLPSIYAYGVQKAQGLGTPRHHTVALELFEQAAVGHRHNEEGSMNSVQYECPVCKHWNVNQITFDKPKGDTRCMTCREDRVFPKDLISTGKLQIGDVTVAPDATAFRSSTMATQTPSSPNQSNTNSVAALGVDSSGAPRRRKLETKRKASAENTQEVDPKLSMDGGSQLRERRRRGGITGSHSGALALGIPSGMFAASESTFHKQLTRAGGHQVTMLSTGPVGSPLPGVAGRSPLHGTRTLQPAPGSSHGGRDSHSRASDRSGGSPQRSPILGGVRGHHSRGGLAEHKHVEALKGKELEEAVKIVSLEYQADPKLMHVLAHVGGFIRLQIENMSGDPVGPFHVELYLTNDDTAPDKAALPLPGGRVYVAQLPGQSEAVVRVDMSARCPVGAKTGEAKLWAGIRAVSHDEIQSSFPELCKRAVDGNRPAIWNLADVTWHGQAGVARDLREALRWYDKIVGTTTKKGPLGSLTSVDLHVMLCGPLPMDLAPMTKACGLQRAWLTYALSLDGAGEPDRKHLSAWELELVGEGFEVIPEFGEAASWMHLAAEHGNLPQAQLNLAVWYAHGRHLPKSIPQAWYWFKRAADQGLPDAKYQLGILHQEGDGVEKDDILAAELFTEAVDQGHVPSHLSLGICYLDGVGVDQDQEQAVRLLTVPARAGMAIAQFNLGCLYSRGEGVEKDAAEAATWFLRATQQNHREGRICYAMALYKGDGVQTDLVEAARLLELSATEGHLQAQYNVGVMYARGEGVAQSRETAAQWWELSADQGHAYAQLELGQHHRTLSEEAEASFEDLISNLVRKFCVSQELFDKYITVERFKTGFGQVRRPLAMDARMLTQLLEKTMLVVPSRMSRENVHSLVTDVNQECEYDDTQFGFDMFLKYMQALCSRIGLTTPSETFSKSTSEHAWAAKKRELAILRKKEKLARKERDLVVKEMSDAKTLVDCMRGIAPTKPVRMSDATRRIREAETELDLLAEEERKERETLKFLRWRQAKSKERYLYCKQMADGLGQRMKIQESNEKHREAERYRKDGEKVVLLMARQEEAIKRIQRRLKKATGNRAAAAAIVGETVGQFDMDAEHDAEEAQQLLESETAVVRKGRDDAERSRREHMERAAELFLQAAEQGLVEAQVVVADMYSAGGRLPDSWIPNSEGDLSDRDRVGLLQYRAALDAARQRRRQKEKEKFVAFSFQADVERLVAQQVQEEKTRRLEDALREYAHIQPPTDQNHPGYKMMMRATSSTAWHAPRDEAAQSQLEFEEWYAKRCRAERAAYWFMQAADGGHAGAQYQVGMMYIRGFQDDDDPQQEGMYVPLPLDKRLAVAWLARASEGGHADAMCEFGLCLLRGVGVKADVEAAQEWLHKSAGLGVPEGMYQLGLCYERGQGVKRDAEKAVTHYREAAERDHVNAQVALAICLERGEGVGQNEAEAVEWYRRAGAQSSEAQYLLGKCLEDGRGVGQDHRQAASLFGQAASRHATAQLQLGVAHQYGIGVRRDAAEAFRCFVRAASQGSADAALNVALCYSSGTGVQEDMHKYRAWLQKAAAAGNARAAEMLSIQTDGRERGSRPVSRLVSPSQSRVELSRLSI